MRRICRDFAGEGRKVKASLGAAALCLALLGCATAAGTADPMSDAPEGRTVSAHGLIEAASYAEAVLVWRTPEDLNAWMGSRFEYDPQRAIRLSETQRQRDGTLPIHPPESFYANPRGVCVDLSRFAVETLRAVAPDAKAAYVMIEFDPVSIGGNVLRRHWVASFERAGRLYFFADSKRPGHIYGPYASQQDFAADYARYRGRQIISIKALASYQRQVKSWRQPIQTRRVE